MYRGLFLADIHIGALPYEQTVIELEYLKKLLRKYTKHGPLDFIIIGGDYFDKQFFASDDNVKLAQKLMIMLLVSAKTIRVVYGTASHESSQYHIFEALTKDLTSEVEGLDFDFRVIYHVEEEELLPGMKVLYIPEEYIYNKNEYYKEYLSKEKEYAYIFGHGMIMEAFHGRIKEDSGKDSKRKKAPHFNAGELSYACFGDVLFGHYHIHTEMEENVAYVGSYSRWIQGEERDKGFFQLFYDEETKTCERDFVVNTEALNYMTYVFGYNDTVFTDTNSWEDTAMKIVKMQKRHNIHRFRVIFNIPVGYENPEAFISFFRERFKSSENIRVEFSNGYTEKKLESARERIDTLPSEHRVFIDKNVPEEVKISMILKIKRGVDISAETLKKYLETK